MGALLTERQIAAQHRKAGIGERGGERNQQRGIAVRSGAVRENERVARGLRRQVQMPANRRIAGRRILEWFALG